MTDNELATQLHSAIFTKDYELAGTVSHQVANCEFLQQTINNMISVYAKWGNLEAIEFCLTSPLLKVNADIHYLEDMTLQQAALYYEFDIVKYLLTSPELKKHANINEPKGFVLMCAAEIENIDLIEYFLFSKDLKTHSQIHFNNDICFINACLKNKQKSVNYFIFDYNITKTQAITNFINDNENFDYLNDIFAKRDLYNRLYDIIPEKINVIQKNKI